MAAPEYKVLVEPHGRTITVAAGRPILEGALAAGLNLPHSCKSGHCASCRARLRSGKVEYPSGIVPAGLTSQEAQAGNILLCQARALSDLVVEARLIACVTEVDIKTLPCRIARLTLLAPDVMQVFLRLPAVETLRFHAGQYIDVLLDGGRRRSFSIASPPHDSELLELHVRRVAGGAFTERLFAGSSALGSLLRIEGPLGQFVYAQALGAAAHGPGPARDSDAAHGLDASHGSRAAHDPGAAHDSHAAHDPGAAHGHGPSHGPGPLLMIAGGTGFAPLKAMLRHVLEGGVDRPIHFYWGARQAHDVYEDTLVLEWVRQYPQLRFTAVLSEATETKAAHHRLGWVHEAVLADHPNLAPFDVYAAGPPALVEVIRSTFPQRGVREDRLFFDSFDYASDSKPVT